MKNKLFLAALSTLLLCSCASYEVTYSLALKSVVSPSLNKQGTIEVLMQCDSLGPRYSYIDNDICTVWSIGRKSIYFYIQNLTTTTMRIDDIGISYSNIYGRASRLHGTPTAPIIPGSWDEATLLPTDNLYTTSYRDSHGHIHHIPQATLLIPAIYGSVDAMKEGAPTMLGKTLKVMLPIMHGDEYKEYIFIFEVTNYKLDDYAGKLDNKPPFYSGRSK